MRHLFREGRRTHDLPPWRTVLVVVAHPDDESFALGALVDRFVADGATVSVLCLTRGEASTLGGETTDLGATRDRELSAAAGELGVGRTVLLAHPDGDLVEVGTLLAADVEAEVGTVRPDGLLVFDPRDGVTGHADHAAASVAAVSVAHRHDIPVLGWALPESVSAALNAEYGTAFVGYREEELLTVAVDRTRQLRAVRCHTSQAVPGSVLWRRLELLGDREYLRAL